MALTLDGVDDAVRWIQAERAIGDLVAADGACTIAWWERPVDTGFFQRHLHLSDSAGAGEIRITDIDTALRGLRVTTGSTQYRDVSLPAYSAGSFVVMRFPAIGSTPNTWVNGSPGTDLGSQAGTGTITRMNQIVIGNRLALDADWHKGGIAEVAVWSVGLSDAECANLSNGYHSSWYTANRTFHASFDGTLTDTVSGLAGVKVGVGSAVYETHPTMTMPPGGAPSDDTMRHALRGAFQLWRLP